MISGFSASDTPVGGLEIRTGTLTTNTTWYNTVGGIVMLVARFAPMIFALGLAGSLARQQTVPESVGTMPTHKPLFVGMPHYPTHPPFLFGLTKKHGDLVLEGGISSAADSIAMGTHVGTHIDALCHFSCGGKFYQVHSFFRPTPQGDFLIRINSMDLRDDGTVYFLAVTEEDEVVLYEARPL